MAQKNESGREPISYLCLKQKSCANTWSQLPCTAGRNNYFNDTVNYDSGTEWNTFGWTATIGLSGDPTGGPDRNRFVYGGGTSAMFPITDCGNNDFSSRMYYIVWLRKDAGNVSHVRMVINTDNANRRADVNFSNGVIEFFDTSSCEVEEDNGYYKLIVGMDLAIRDGTTVSFSMTFGKDASITAPDVNSEFSLYGLMATPTRNGPYIPVTTGPVESPIVSDQPCFNTRQSCQDPDNFDLTEMPIKFVLNRSPLPRDDYYLPMLSSTSVSPGELNPGGSNRSQSAMGKRSVLSATFQDAPHNDRLTDQYRTFREYDPLEQGTFFTKWRARNPFYLNTPVDLVTGYLFQGQIIETVTKSYVMTDFSGPDAGGAVSIKAKDILSLAEDTKAQAPIANTGVLSAAMNDTALSITLLPAGIGDLEYPTSGKIRIEKEVIDFTRVGGSDTLTLGTRGIEGTTADSHEEGAVVQVCLEYSSQNYSNILFDLLNVYAGIDASFLNKVGWDAEAAAYSPNVYSTIISEPTSVAQLVGEMCQQMYFSVWWDEKTSLVETKMLRSAQDDVVTDLTDTQHIIADSVKWTDKPNELITQVWVFYGQINPTIKLDQESNYATAEIVKDPDAETSEKHDTRKIKKIFSRWIPLGNASAANNLANAILTRFVNIPRSCELSVDAKDDQLWLGDFIRVENRLKTDLFGVPEKTNLQILRAQDSLPGDTLSFTAQEYIVQETIDPNQIEIIYSVDTLNVNLRDQFESQVGRAPLATDVVNVTIRPGVIIGGDAANYTFTNLAAIERSTSNDEYDGGTSSISGLPVGDVPMLQRAGIVSPRTILKDGTYPATTNTADWEIREFPQTIAFDTGTWPVGAVLKLTIQAGAQILGEGGNGSSHSFKEDDTDPNLGNPYKQTVKAGDGGHAMRIQYPIEITNGGIISQGCGGGASLAVIGASALLLNSGGGGAGYLGSKVKPFIDDITAYYIITGANPGGDLDGGAGATGGLTDPVFNAYARHNREDGQPKGFGGSSTSPTGEQATHQFTNSSGTPIISGPILIGIPGDAGDAITSGANDITWINKGDVRGTENP